MSTDLLYPTAPRGRPHKHSQTRAPAEARKVLDDVQAAPIDKLPVEDHWVTVPAEVGEVDVRIVRPPGAKGTLP